MIYRAFIIAGACCLALLMHLFSAMPSDAAGLDFSKAVTIGNGPKTVIEFTDPDCPFCRRASKYFDSRTDTTRYVFFMPLEKHPEAKRKAQYILSQLNRAKAYHEVMSGKFDGAPQSNLPITAKGTRLQTEHKEIAKKAGVESTPTFMIFGRIVEGFDLAKIEALLGKP